MPVGKYLRTEEHRKNMSKARKGRHLSDETKRKMSEAKKGNKNPMYGKPPHHSAESKRKISEAKKGHKGHKASEETKTKLRQYTGEKSSGWKGGKVKTNCKTCGKEMLAYPGHVKTGRARFCSLKCSGIGTAKHMKKKDTSIELAIEQELVSRNIPHLKQAPIENIALVDFLLPNRIIIQCDGDYWHSKKINKGRDIAQDTVLFFKGYKIFRFWEKDINKSASKCIDKVIKNTSENLKNEPK